VLKYYDFCYVHNVIEIDGNILLVITGGRERTRRQENDTAAPQTVEH